MRSVLALALALTLSAPALAANPFSDVPKTHWAYAAIQKAVEQGILQGYNGAFEGQRLLNRYQMAVIVAKLVEAAKSPADKGKAGPSTAGDLEKLTAEFADELALLHTRVATLEGATLALAKDVEGLKGGTGGGSAGNLGFTAFASFALVDRDGDPEVDSGYTRFGESAGQTFFTLPQVSLGVDKEVNEGVYFHAQLDYASHFTEEQPGQGLAPVGTVRITEASFLVDELLGDVGGKVGAFATPFSMEHNGPFRTCTYTITPSMVNSFNEAWRGYGIEFQPVANVEPGNVSWKLAVLSGTDGPASRPHTGTLDDRPVGISNEGELDDNFGYWIYVGQKAEGKGFGWMAGYLDNGGDTTVTPTFEGTEEAKAWQVGLEWWSDKFGVLGQYQDVERDGSNWGWTAESDVWYLLVNYTINDGNDVSLRYGSLQDDSTWLGTPSEWELTEWCFAFNHQVTENSVLQFEWLTADSGMIDWPDAEDDLVQLRYKVHF